jgi:2-oxoglutarate dehydrogenase complex dehydrogenase (E1) component-like enzyme
MPRLRNLMKSLKRDPEVKYVGRSTSAATATGYGKVHEMELKNLLQEALKV